MKKISLFIQLAVLTAAMPAFGWVGGPFDNGDYGILMERGGFYQATFSYKNGSGYGIWTPDNLQGDVNSGGSVVTNIAAGSLLTPAAGTQGSHNGNRSVFYYKGVTYIGSAMGEITLDERKIQGFCNASSEYITEAATVNQQANLLSQSTTASFGTSTVVSSGRSYVINLNWRGDVTDTAPQMTFEGKGEMTIIAPNGREALANLAYEGYRGLIQAIIQAVSQSGGEDQNGFIFTQAQTAIQNALLGTPSTPAATNTTSNATVTDNITVVNGVVTNNTQTTIGTSVTTTTPATAATGGLLPFLEGTGPDNSYDEAIKESVKVSGIRRFF